MITIFKTPEETDREEKPWEIALKAVEATLQDLKANDGEQINIMRTLDWVEEIHEQILRNPMYMARSALNNLRRRQDRKKQAQKADDEAHKHLRTCHCEEQSCDACRVIKELHSFVVFMLNSDFFCS